MVSKKEEARRAKVEAERADLLDGGAEWDLLPLTPKYLKSEHGRYVAAIVSALENPKVRNIAVSGNYGVGKSSILQRVSELESERVVELSLSTLAPIASVLDESVPVQATTPTNRIQQEIVKQLLYREDPNKASSSRFRRIERFQPKRELALAAIVGFAATVLFVLLGWGTTIATTLKPVIDLGLWMYLVLFGLAFAGVYSLRYLLHGRVHIKAFSAGPAAVTLDEKSVSYFDQYLDEIVYFFETSSRDIVIFEDIDRFNDSHIFETLRSLNTLLNASPQIDRPIRFVYAIKDSIFDRIGLESEGRKDATLADIKDPAAAESVRANRTKFFDLVIPVVPFITHRSARNLASQLLEGVENKVSPDLIDLAGRFVPDMRLLKNVRNEFVVFRDRIFAGDGLELELSETDLFAMMLYKSTHLTDFETIRLGKSKLDSLYASSRELVTANIRRLEHEMRATRQQIARAKSAPTRATRIGNALLAHISRTARAAGYYEQGQQYSLLRAAKTPDALKGVEFWREFTEAPEETTLNWRNSSGHSMAFGRADLAAALGDDLAPDAWVETDQTGLKEALDEQLEQLDFLRSADMGALIKRPEFLVEFEEVMQSLESVAEALLSRGLAFNLVRAGYINRNFTLYTSTFHGDRVSSAATNFIIHHVEQNTMDAHFLLSGDDVDAVVRERGTSALSEPALFNIAILDHLLAVDVDKADVMITSLARLNEDALQFLSAYLTSGVKRAEFLERFARKSMRVLPYLVTQAELDDAARVQLVSDTLANLAPGVKYIVDDATTRFLAERYAELPVLTSDPIDPSAAARIVMTFGMAGIKLPELHPLTEVAREAFVARNVFTLTRENLLSALGAEADLALDSIHAANEDVYGYVLDNLGTYLDVVGDHSASNEAEDGFVRVIEDVIDRDVDLLSDVVARASERSRVPRLSSVPDVSWPFLARSTRFPATFDNITSYIEIVGSLDADLAKVLKATGSISEVDSAEEAEKVQLGHTILAVRPLLHSTVRVPLVVSLKLAGPLDASVVPTENSPLLALLLESHLVPDDVDTYERIGNIDWQWREQFIRASRNFKTFMTPGLVGDHLGQLLSSQKVGKSVKLAILEDAVEFAVASDASGRRELARFAMANSRQLPIEVVEQLATDRADAATVTVLLKPYLATLDAQRLDAILRSLGGPYAQLTYVGRDRPTFQNTPANLALLALVESRGIVSKFDATTHPVVVYKKHK